MEYKKEVHAQEYNYVKARVLRDGVMVDSKKFGYADCSLICFMFGSDKKRREQYFKRAHEWADTYIEQLIKYEE